MPAVIRSFPLQHYHRAHQAQHYCLQPWMLAQQDGHVSHIRRISPDTPYNVGGSVQKILTARVQLSVVCIVIVSFGQKLQWFIPVVRSGSASTPCCNQASRGRTNSPSSKSSNYPVHYRYVLPLDIVHDHLPNLRILAPVPKK